MLMCPKAGLQATIMHDMSTFNLIQQTTNSIISVPQYIVLKANDKQFYYWHIPSFPHFQTDRHWLIQ